jgi:hypothetical protein
MDLFLVEHIPEALHLIYRLLNPDPELRFEYYFSSNRKYFLAYYGCLACYFLNNFNHCSLRSSMMSGCSVGGDAF